MVNQNKIVSFKIKRLGKNDIPSDVERTAEHCQNNPTHIFFGLHPTDAVEQDVKTSW